MYSESDLEAAVAAGALTPDAANALRTYVAGTRTTPAVDEEHFRLLTGFNDIFGDRGGDPAGRGRLDRQCDTAAPGRRRPLPVRRLRGCRNGLGPGRVLHPQAAHGAAEHPAAAGLRGRRARLLRLHDRLCLG
jgi:hypothetical protein